jgi:hypothetical protein
MKMGLRAQICCQCRPEESATETSLPIAPLACESGCSLFVQLPRLARFYQLHSPRPPSGYEDFALQMLGDASSAGNDPAKIAGPYLDYSAEALAILERMTYLLTSLQPRMKI